MTLGIMGYVSCTPDRYVFHEADFIDPNEYGGIKLYVSHDQLLADGKATVEFTPMLITKDSIEITTEHIDYSLIKYRFLSGEEIAGNTFSTSDQKSIGKEISVYATVEGTSLMSDTVSFVVTDPSLLEGYNEITIPVIFHLIQCEDDIMTYGGEMPKERIYLLFDKMNNAFSGTASTNPTGIDTKIRFELALYDPEGELLAEPGINRIYTADLVKDEQSDDYASLIKENGAMWDYTKYLNIWLLGSTESSTKFVNLASACKPRYVYSTSDLETAIPGLSFSELAENWEPVPKEIGILYKLSSCFVKDRGFGIGKVNELNNALGYYFGLLATWLEYDPNIPEDYCSDTQGYYGRWWDGFNSGMYKTMGDVYFLSENIMDDANGMHRSVTQEQALRVHWVLQHCPERSAWKSDFAFTGK